MKSGMRNSRTVELATAGTYPVHSIYIASGCGQDLWGGLWQGCIATTPFGIIMRHHVGLHVREAALPLG